MNSKRSPIRRAAAAAAAGAALLALAGCGGNDGTADRPGGHAAPSPSAAASSARQTHNAADVAFAQGMVPHHRQAVEMADLAASRAGSAEVRKLAEDVRKAQAPEIRTLSGWLASWGEEVPAGDGTGHSAHGAEGMMGAGEMARLEKSSGKAFDTAFLELMIRHHAGAVSMAEAERAEGAHAPAKKMAGEIITAQTDEIALMEKLLGRD
ncbi:MULTISPECIES: DUF305 domain-containing protein [unclassified Streptomyces]|uniref:DUF305 domain-containing protein n=1 Tax=unclassified Streptomyces TaxID=2593676 RepID=UPI000F45DF47|nr:DUF305 domain-containing protein [Streptomyces sp. I6]RNL73338.1 DUF305 domain-containing protein [Streptomyces sp. I6]